MTATKAGGNRLEIGRLQERDEGIRDRALTGNIETVPGRIAASDRLSA
jgi:hypothetical protein